MNDGKQFNLNADTEDSNMMTQRSDPSKEPAPDTNTTATEPTTNNNITATQPAAGGEDASATDDPMLNRYRNGFKVAINYLYHHHDDADKEKFKAFLETHIPAEHVAEAISLKSNMEDAAICPPGTCPNGAGGCDLCTFDLAFDETYFS